MYKEILVSSINKWTAGIFHDILPSVQNPPVLSSINSMVGAFLGIDLSKYNIVREFSFILPNLLSSLIESSLLDLIEKLNIPDESIPEKFAFIIDSCILECKRKGTINIFGLQFNEKSFINLKKIYTTALENAGYNTYTSGSED